MIGKVKCKESSERGVTKVLPRKIRTHEYL